MCYSLLLPLQRWISLGLSNQIIKRSIGEDSEVNHSSPIISCVHQRTLPGLHFNRFIQTLLRLQQEDSKPNMSRPCKVPYCQSYWYRYKEDCESELEANTQEIEDLRYEGSDLKYEVDGLSMFEVSKLSDQLSEATKEWMLAERRFEDLRVEKETKFSF